MEKEQEYKQKKARVLRRELIEARSALETELKKLYNHQANSFFAELMRIKAIAEEMKEMEPTRSHFIQIGFEV